MCTLILLNIGFLGFKVTPSAMIQLVVHGVFNRIVYPTVYSWNFCSGHAVYTVFYKTFRTADDQDVWAFGGHSNVQYIFTMLRVSLSGRPIDVLSSAP